MNLITFSTNFAALSLMTTHQQIRFYLDAATPSSFIHQSEEAED